MSRSTPSRSSGRSGDAGSSWQDLSDPLYRATAGFATDVAAGPDGRVYVATFGNGVVVGASP